MSILKIRTYGDKVLREKAREISEVTPKLKQLALDMLDTMYEAPGIGLAAPQVGESIRLIVVDLWDGESERKSPLILFNPTITHSEGSYLDEEGCLSFPGIQVKVKRFQKITLEAINEDNEKIVLENCEGLLARCIQHELDHLDGVLFVDRISPTDKLLIHGKLKKLSKQKA